MSKVRFDDMKERADFRARKRLFQFLTSRRRHDQLDRLGRLDWDVLVVLDACRRDVLSNAAAWPVDRAVSPASCTPEWLKAAGHSGVFSGKHIVSGNPQYAETDAELGHETLEPYWRTHWNEPLQTSLPEPILDRVHELSGESSAGVVAHLQQPHWPYIAKVGESWALAYDGLGPWSVGDATVTSVQVAMQRGLIDVQRARKAYAASVRSVWQTLTEYVAKWIDSDYTVVVTADHGETFGSVRDFGFYEHPCRCHIPSLISVPWVEFSPADEPRGYDDGVTDKLRALGYST